MRWSSCLPPRVFRKLSSEPSARRSGYTPAAKHLALSQPAQSAEPSSTRIHALVRIQGRTDVESTALLTAWENFYVIVGSSGAALTGLQFVVIALVAETSWRRSSTEIDAFGTPTVVHFCAVLFIAAVLSAPWRTLFGPAIVLGISGFLGLVYAIVIGIRTRAQTSYQPVLEDWLFHAVFPFIAYGTLLVAALNLRQHPTPALFSVGALSLLLLFIGIHNAWDTVTYITVGPGKNGNKPPAE